MQVAIADVTVSIGKDQLLFFRGKLGRVLDQLASLLNNLVVMARGQTDIVLERL